MSLRPAAARLSMPTTLGTFEAGTDDVIAFPSGLPGFEDCKRFVLLSAGAASPFYCLREADGLRASFLSIDPRVVLADYRTTLNAEDVTRLQADDRAPLLWLSLLTVDPAGRVFANLRAPVVINPARMIGAQVLPHDALYSLRHPVAVG
jgi:flagellar assembly factor FliW